MYGIIGLLIRPMVRKGANRKRAMRIATMDVQPPIAINEKLSKRVEKLLHTKYTDVTMYTRKVVKSLSKTVSVSARINEDLFNAFKDAYLDQLKGSFKEDTPEEIVKSLSNPSNSELVALAFSFGLKGIKGQQEG